MTNSSGSAGTLKQKQIDTIRDSAAKAEKDGKLTKAQIGLFTEHNWFGLLAPAAYGGLQLSVPEAMQILEELAAADGSTGWLAAKSALAGWAAGFVTAEAGKEVFTEEKIYMAASNEASGTAEKIKNGYTVNGTWKHVTGAGDAIAFVANCTIMENGATIKDEAHKEQVLSFILLKDEVNMTPCTTMGLSGTSCQEITATGVKVPVNRAFLMTGEHATSTQRLYQYPALQLSEAVLAVTVSGMAQRFVELCKTMLSEMKDIHGVPVTDDLMVQDAMDKYTNKMNDARVKLFYAAELTWQACTNQQNIKDTILYKVSAAAQDMTRKARECADALLPFCGFGAMERGTEINRVWRDLHAASQERVLVFGGL